MFYSNYQPILIIQILSLLILGHRLPFEHEHGLTKACTTTTRDTQWYKSGFYAYCMCMYNKIYGTYLLYYAQLISVPIR